MFVAMFFSCDVAGGNMWLGRGPALSQVSICQVARCCIMMFLINYCALLVIKCDSMIKCLH